jgi:dTDP-4-amino-4,6-dideoxygalactose transaminase
MSEAARCLSVIPPMCPRAFFEEHKQEIIKAMVRVLDSGKYILGEEVRLFEQEFAHQFGFADAVGVGSGTDAIALALKALGVKRDARVVTVSHTAVATVAAIEMAGAEPVFADIRADTYTLDPDSLSRILEAVDGVTAVIAVHLYGHPADMPAILRIAGRYGVRVIEDCAQALGATLDGHFVGSMADVATFSFYPTKSLGAFGDGGMIVSNDLACTDRVRRLREYGWVSRHISDIAGVNSRLDELQAAVLRVRLPYLEAGNRRRLEIAAAYDRGFQDTDLILPRTRPGAAHVYHQYVIRYPERDQLKVRIESKGAGTNIHYPAPVHKQPAYEGRCKMDPAGLVTTEAVAGEVLSLPMYPELADRSIDTVIDAVRTSIIRMQ